MYCHFNGQNFWDGILVSLNIDNGELIKRLYLTDEYVASTLKDNLYCILPDSSALVCRSKEFYNELWRMDGFHGSINQTAIENDTLIIECFEGFHSCNALTGELYGKINIKLLFEEYFSGYPHYNVLL